MISSIPSFEIINAVVPGIIILLWITESTADAAAVNLHGIKIILANGLSTFLITDNAVFSNGPRSLTRNPPNCTV